MKKLVPDPPPILCVGPGLSHDDAIQRATEHLVKAIQYAACLPDPPNARHQELLDDALLNMRICKALLTLSVSASPLTVAV